MKDSWYSIVGYTYFLYYNFAVSKNKKTKEIFVTMQETQELKYIYRL